MRVGRKDDCDVDASHVTYKKHDAKPQATIDRASFLFYFLLCFLELITPVGRKAFSALH